MADVYLNSDETGKIRRKSRQALAAERKRGEGPPYIVDGNRILYDEADVHAWMAARRVEPEATQPPTPPKPPRSRARKRPTAS